jgi:hypothetical protein
VAEPSTSQGIPVSDLPWRLGRRWIRPRRLAKIPDQPIVHLLRNDDANALINQLSEHLGTLVPKVKLDVGNAPDNSQQKQSVQIRGLLDKAAQRLREADSSPRIGRLRFRRYALLSWLLSKNVPPTSLVHGPNANTRQLLREYLSSRRPRRDKHVEAEAAAWSSAAQQLPWYLFVLSQVFFPLYYAWWVRRGRIPRWFMRQHYLSPRESADFPSFAQRLITTPSRRENAEQVRKLLVHAFLTDLSEAYTRRLWRWRWVPKDCYPVLLLRSLEPDTVGETLVRLFNDVRNETGARDPLLVIGAGTRTLPDAQSASESGTLDKWQQALQEARRRRSPTAWYVPLVVADETSSEDEPGYVMGRTELPLKHSRLLRRIPAIALVLLLLGGTGAYFKQYFGPCGQLLPWHGLGLWAEGSECVGISDGTFQFSANIPAEDDAEIAFRSELVGLQETIERQNRHAADENALNPEKPYVTIVYFSTLTAPDRNSSTLNGVVEELRGLAHAQNAAQLDGGVLIRIVLANGGARMAHGPEVAERIAGLAERSADSVAPVVGVVGLGGSWAPTRDSIKVLGEAGLPMVGTTTSADEFKDVSKLYHQVGPDNKRQARVVAQYIRARYGTPRVKIYYSSDDLYSENLARDLGDEFALPPDRLDARNPPFRDDIPCGQGELLFFAGRADQLGRFLESVSQRCRSLGQDVPRLMAGDDITKFMLDRTLPIGLELEYTSFYDTIDRDEGLTGRAMLANDTIEVLQQAVHNVTGGTVAADGKNPVPLNGLSVWRGIAEVNGVGRVSGTTGIIDFGPESGQVPVDKAISIVHMDGPNTNAEVVWKCGNGLESRDPGCTTPN